MGRGAGGRKSDAGRRDLSAAFSSYAAERKPKHNPIINAYSRLCRTPCAVALPSANTNPKVMANVRIAGTGHFQPCHTIAAIIDK